MNNKSIQLPGRKPYRVGATLWYLLMLVIGLLCCGYIVAVGSFFVGPQPAASGPSLLSADVLEQIGTIRDRRLGEISGIAFSRRFPDKFWVHNDSGNTAQLFLVDADGSVVASVKLENAVNRDWEDICTFDYNGTPTICVGDVGDNRGKYKDYQLYVLPEPELDLEQSSKRHRKESERVVANFSKIVFRYEDGPKNCEALAWDADSNSFLLAEKGFDREAKSNPGIYRLQIENGFNNTDQLVAIRVADCRLKRTTAMSISGDGRRMVLASYAVAGIWDRPATSGWVSTLTNVKPSVMPIPVQRQGEAIALDHGGNVAITTSEHFDQPLWRIRVDLAIKSKAADPKITNE